MYENPNYYISFQNVNYFSNFFLLQNFPLEKSLTKPLVTIFKWVTAKLGLVKALMKHLRYYRSSVDYFANTSADKTLHWPAVTGFSSGETSVFTKHISQHLKKVAHQFFRQVGGMPSVSFNTLHSTPIYCLPSKQVNQDGVIMINI